MGTTGRFIALAATALLPIGGTSALAQNYGSAAGAASALGFTASPPLPLSRAPSVAPVPQEAATTGAIVRYTAHPSIHRHRR